MSVSDYLKYLRAVKGGITPWEIAEASGVPAREIHLLEVKHRRVGDDEAVLRRLAEFFEVPPDELLGRRDAYRKRLTFFLVEGMRESKPVALKLESGEELEGLVDWYSREAVALLPASPDNEAQGAPPCIVQRAWVADWRFAGTPLWEVESGLNDRPRASAGGQS